MNEYPFTPDGLLTYPQEGVGLVVSASEHNFQMSALQSKLDTLTQQAPPASPSADVVPRVSVQEEMYHKATKVLLSLGYDLSSLYMQHRVRLEAYEAAQPTELDRKFSVTTPQTWVTHFEDKTASQPKGFVPTLATNTIRAGGQFLLTRGQRAKLRGYGLTPTRVVEVMSLDFYPTTRCVRSLVLKSCLHVEEHKRKHVLAQVCINDFGAFMQAALDLEHEADEVKDVAEKVKCEKDGKLTNKQISAAIAAQYI